MRLCQREGEVWGESGSTVGGYGKAVFIAHRGHESCVGIFQGKEQWNLPPAVVREADGEAWSDGERGGKGREVMLLTEVLPDSSTDLDTLIAVAVAHEASVVIVRLEAQQCLQREGAQAVAVLVANQPVEDEWWEKPGHKHYRGHADDSDLGK